MFTLLDKRAAELGHPAKDISDKYRAVFGAPR